MKPATQTFGDRVSELEFRIRTLATSYQLGEDCIDPITGDVVPDPVYDDMVDELRQLCPDSEVLQDVDPTLSGHDPNAKIVKHDPPMTSIEKANGTEIVKAEVLADWMADCLGEIGYMKSDPCFMSLDMECEDPFRVFKQRLAQRGYNFVPQAFEQWFSLLYKRDGVACRIYYEKGHLVAAGLRPRNGVDGEDITANIRYVQGVPENIDPSFTGAIQGELYCKRSVFARINNDLMSLGKVKVPYANERNYTAGSIRQFKDPAITADREIAFVFHGTAGVNTKHDWKTELERARWATAQNFDTVRVSGFRFETLAELEALVPSLDYLVDGIVIKVSDLHDQEELGNHGGKSTGNPRGAIAWKFRDEIAESVVTAIDAQPGRTGGLTPVLKFGTVRLAGTNVSQATGHNLSFLARNKIKVGTRVGIKKSGMIIPCVEYVVCENGKSYVAEVESEYTGKEGKKLQKADLKGFVYADECPSCGHKTEIEGGSAGNFELICPNNLCPAQIVRTFSHFLSVMGVKGIGPSTLGKLVGAGFTSPAQFYKYDVEDLESVGLSRRESLLAVAAIHRVNNPSQYKDVSLIDRIQEARAVKKKVPIWQLFASFGIYGAGETAGKLLQQHFHTLEAIRSASAEELATVEGIGPVTAQAVEEFFKTHGEIIDELLDFIEVEDIKTGKLTGMTFCLSGGFEPNKNYWKKKIEDEGGITKDNVSKGLTYLVEGENAGSKVEKAKSLNAKAKDGHTVKIINANQLQELMES